VQERITKEAGDLDTAEHASHVDFRVCRSPAINTIQVRPQGLSLSSFPRSLGGTFAV